MAGGLQVVDAHRERVKTASADSVSFIEPCAAHIPAAFDTKSHT